MDLKRAPLTTEVLRRYNAADLDPYTVELAQSLCERFTLSQVGHRNLSDTFSSLPDIQIFEQNFEVGYGRHHPAPAILNSDSGSVLAAIVGSLSEYFTEHVVVDFFILLTKRADVPRVSRPRPEQWRRLVEVFYGILMPSTFGFLLSTIAAACPRLVAEPDPERILKALDKMSERTKHRAEHTRAQVIEADSEAVYLTAVSTWLFGLSTTINTISNDVVYRSSPTDAPALIEIQLMPQRTVSAHFDGLMLSPKPRVSEQNKTIDVTGGRVSFERMFEASFSTTFKTMSKDSLSTFVTCASKIIQHNHRHDLETLRGTFISQGTAKKEDEKHSLKETLFAWCPEIRRLSSRCERHSHLNVTESRDQLEKAMSSFRDQCACSLCKSEGASNTLCQVVVAMLVVKFGLSVSRIVLSPKVYLKEYGIMLLYEQCRLQYATWRSCGTSVSVSEYFTYNTLGMLPETTDLLHTACLLFTASDPAANLPSDTHLMGVTHRGFAISLTMFVDVEEVFGGQANVHSVRVMPGWMCPFGHEMKLEIYDPAYSEMTFAESWNVVRSKQKDVRQVLRRDGDVVFSSLVNHGTQQEEQAKLDGWLIVNDELD